MKTNVDNFNPEQNIRLVNTTVQADIELLDDSDLLSLKEYVTNLTKLLRTSNSESVVERRGEIRAEINRVVTWLYSYNINLTNLLTRI